MIVSKNTQDALMELIKQCYAANRFLDRCVSLLGVKFVMPITADLCHHGLAHYFPRLADKIVEQTLERYNVPVAYGATPEAAFDYDDAVALIDDMAVHIVEFQTMFMGVCKIAADNNDIHVYADLLDMLEDVNEVVGQALLLADKVKLYGGNMMAFDKDVGTFWFLKEGD